MDYYRSLPLTRWADARHRRWEAEALRLADVTTTVSHHWAEDLSKLGGHNLHVITNGYDTDDYGGLLPYQNGKFTLTHLGLLGSDRQPLALLRAIKELNEELPDFRQQFVLQLVGEVSPSFIAAAQAAGLTDAQLVLTGQLPRNEALARAAGSSINVLLLNQQPNAAGRIPYKCFEYLGLGRPVLAYGPPASDVAAILNTTSLGTYLDYNAVAETKTQLSSWFTDYQAGLLGSSGEGRSVFKAYDFHTLTGRLAGLLDGLVDEGLPRR
ncbi:MAG: glycosyltransferase family 4 protein [Lewinella sp.]|nr:glycosyltransferase family 4 protein [Lewinella sp.]